MNNLQAGRMQPGQNGQQNSEMRQQMDKLGEIMRRQQEMMNETFRMDQMQPGQQGQGGEQQQGENGARPATGPGPTDDARGIRRSDEAAAAGPGPAAGRSRSADEEPRRHGHATRDLHLLRQEVGYEAELGDAEQDLDEPDDEGQTWPPT